MFRVFRSDWYDSKLKKLTNVEQEICKNFEQQLKEKPYAGKPLGYKFFREKRAEGYRFYFLIYEEYVVVFVITLSDKKGQQDAINKIKSLIPTYRQEIKKKLNL